MLRFLRDNALQAFVMTRFGGRLVGEDEFGNRYFRRPRGSDWRKERRWVIYAGKGEIEPSSVPPGWNAWLHHNLQDLPTEANLPHKRWEKPYLPNLSGTPQAYVPAGHELRGGKRARATGDYEAWRP